MREGRGDSLCTMKLSAHTVGVIVVATVLVGGGVAGANALAGHVPSSTTHEQKVVPTVTPTPETSPATPSAPPVAAQIDTVEPTSPTAVVDAPAVPQPTPADPQTEAPPASEPRTYDTNAGEVPPEPRPPLPATVEPAPNVGPPTPLPRDAATS